MTGHHLKIRRCSLISEKTILIGVKIPRINEEEFNYSLDELACLAKSAGAVVCDVVKQNRTAPDITTYIGKGKIEELKQIADQNKAQLIIFDHDLTGSQVKNIEEAVGIRVIDRTELILDIFAQRAHTAEAKLQVELAQLNYLLPRLIGLGLVLSRLGGGIGTVGPGETKLEYDRRRIKTKISHLQKDIRKVSKVRAEQRKGRKKFPIAAIVGYTNAGKSTLLKTLTKTKVRIEDRLFTTLDTKISKITLDGGRKELLLIDTVGFIQNLPHHLVDSFKATLEEVKEADILLHVVDASSPFLETQMAAVQTVLKQLEACLVDTTSTPMVTVFNKIDLLDNNEASLNKASLLNQVSKLVNKIPHSVAISALSGENINHLIQILSRLVIPKFKQRKDVHG
ncbi:MAG: GTPase HflX [Nitrospirota bacterium]